MKKDLSKSAEELRRLGRNGDTILAHINPREAALLKSMGGAGSTNPKSGLPEFFDYSFSAPSYSFDVPSYSYTSPAYTAPVYEAPTPVSDPFASWQTPSYGWSAPTYEYKPPSDPVLDYKPDPYNFGGAPKYNSGVDLTKPSYYEFLNTTNPLTYDSETIGNYVKDVYNVPYSKYLADYYSGAGSGGALAPGGTDDALSSQDSNFVGPTQNPDTSFLDGLTSTPDYNFLGPTQDADTSFLDGLTSTPDYSLIGPAQGVDTSFLDGLPSTPESNFVGPSTTPDTSFLQGLPYAPDQSFVGPTPDVDTSFLDNLAPVEQPVTGGLPTIDAPTQEVTPPLPTTGGGLDFVVDGSNALTGDVKVPSDLADSPLPSWSYEADSPEAKNLADSVVQDVFKAPTESKPGLATNGMNMKQLNALKEGGFGDEMISDTQTVNQAIGALQLSQMKPGQALSLMGGLISGNPVAIASSIASIAGAPKVSSILGIASNLASGNMFGAAAGIASLTGQKEAAFAIQMANALSRGDISSIVSGVASMTGNKDLANAISAINAVTSKDPFAIAGVIARYAPTLAGLDTREAADTIATSAGRQIAPTKDFSDAWGYYQQSGAPSVDYLANLQSSILPSGEIDFSKLGRLDPAIFGAVSNLSSDSSLPDVGATSSGALPTASAAKASAVPWISDSDPFEATNQFLSSSPEFLKNAVAPNLIKEVASQEPAAPVNNDLEQIFASLDPSLREVVQERTFASGGSAFPTDTSFKCATAKAFAPCTADFLASSATKRKAPLELAKLKHISQNISSMGNINGLARGGLPQKYRDAAPDGHNPEFVTGLTGFYACGRGTGQSDCIPAMLHDGDYVMDAEAVSALGDGSSKAGREVLEKFHQQVPHQASSGGKVVPAKIADGEYVFPAGFVTALGGGDNKRGADILDGLREKLRNHKRSAPTSKIPPKAKSPLDYLKMAKG